MASPRTILQRSPWRSSAWQRWPRPQDSFRPCAPAAWTPWKLCAMSNDLRFALRTLWKSPVFTAVAVVSLALGIGANTAIFTLLDQVLLRLLPVKDPQQLVLLTMKGFHYGGNWADNALSYPMYRDFKEHNAVFTD